jgi:glycosyltransferase involved in cell wall biosynthesis
MNVLMIGPYLDSTGWGQAARDWLLSMDAAEVNVVGRPFSYGSPPISPPPRIAELIARPRMAYYDICVQIALPEIFEWDGRFGRTIGMFFSEASDFASTNWPRHINAMDEAWVPCQAVADACDASGVNVPVSVVGCGTDPSRFEKSHADLGLRDRLGNSFIFYTIGEATPRKNFEAIVRAFHLEFGPSEPVELVIKASMPWATPEACKVALSHDFARITEDLNLYPSASHYKSEIILTDRMSEDEICRFHSSCDCYVSSACGEGWGLPAFDAMGFGRTPILSAVGACLDYCSDAEGWLVPCHDVPVSGMRDIHSELYTARQSWGSISIDGLRFAMREAYEKPEKRKQKRMAGIERVYNFTHEAVGHRMKGLLEQ